MTEANNNLETEATVEEIAAGVELIEVGEGLSNEIPVEEQLIEEPTENDTEPDKFEVNGEMFTVDELKAGYMRQADYSKKTQAHSVNVAEFEKRQQQVVLDDFYRVSDPTNAQPVAQASAEATEYLTDNERRMDEQIKANQTVLQGIQANEKRNEQLRWNKHVEDVFGLFAKEHSDEATVKVSREINRRGLNCSKANFELVWDAMQSSDELVDAKAQKKMDDYVAEKTKAQDAGLAGGGGGSGGAPATEKVDYDKMYEENPGLWMSEVAKTMSGD